MKNILNSIGAALSLAVAGACSDTALLPAPEVQTLPSPDITLTSQDARTCLGDLFRALAEPEVLCPPPLEDLSEEMAIEAQTKYDECLEVVPEIEVTMSVMVVDLFRPFLPDDFNFDLDSPGEIQEAIANTPIPFTLISENTIYAVDSFGQVFSNQSYTQLITPGFLEDNEELRSGPFAHLLANDIPYFRLSSLNYPGNESNSLHVHSDVSGSTVTPFQFLISCHLNSVGCTFASHIWSENFAEDRSDLLISRFVKDGIISCIEDVVLRVQGEPGTSILHVQ